MIAGTLARLSNPIDEPLESWFSGNTLPGLHVEKTQDSFDDRPIQSGSVATRVDRDKTRVSVGETADGEPEALLTEKTEETVTLHTEWVADVTGTGLIVPESSDGDGQLDFPFDVFWNVADRDIERLTVEVFELHRAWDAEDALGDVWMAGSNQADGTSINYRDSVDDDVEPTIGLGFVRPWEGYAFKGVIYESGYVAIYNTNSATQFIRFVDEEILPYVRQAENDEEEQATLGTPECDDCGRESENLEQHGDEMLCPVCLDKREEETERHAQTAADGGEA